MLCLVVKGYCMSFHAHWINLQLKTALLSLLALKPTITRILQS